MGGDEMGGTEPQALVVDRSTCAIELEVGDRNRRTVRLLPFDQRVLDRCCVRGLFELNRQREAQRRLCEPMQQVPPQVVRKQRRRIGRTPGC